MISSSNYSLLLLDRHYSIHTDSFYNFCTPYNLQVTMPFKAAQLFQMLSVRLRTYRLTYFWRLKRTIILSGPSSRPATPQPTASQPSAPSLLSCASVMSTSFPVTILYSHSTMHSGDCGGALFCSRARARHRGTRLHQSCRRTYWQISDFCFS